MEECGNEMKATKRGRKIDEGVEERRHRPTSSPPLATLPLLKAEEVPQDV